jgi:hypothetical protein
MPCGIKAVFVCSLKLPAGAIHLFSTHSRLIPEKLLPIRTKQQALKVLAKAPQLFSTMPQQLTRQNLPLPYNDYRV